MERAHADDNNISLDRKNSHVVDKLIEDRSLGVQTKTRWYVSKLENAVWRDCGARAVEF